MRYINTFIVIILVVITSACSLTDDGERYIGKWDGEKRDYNGIAYNHVDIVRNGDVAFIVIKRNREIPATLNEKGILETQGGMVSYTILEATGELTDGKVTYTRQ